MRTPDNFDQSERILPLKVQSLDSKIVMITEHNTQKRSNKDFSGDTFASVRSAINASKADKIPPIVVFQNPFNSIDKTIRAYQEFTKAYPRQGNWHFDNEPDILKEILDQSSLLLCYNGNRRLEEFQRAELAIRAYVIESQEEFALIPHEERRIPDRVKDESPTQYQIDQNYLLSFLQLLDDVVFLAAEKRYYDSLDTKGVPKKMLEGRKKR
jgi:hypothetical protein